jgi:Flp pilus assembly protein TadD
MLCHAVGCASLRSAELDRDARRALERGEVAEAVAKLETAARLTPDASPLWNDLGRAYAASGRDLDALAAFARALELDCSNAAARENLAAARARAATALLDAPRSGGDAP